jgi:hypothetical protein
MPSKWWDTKGSMSYTVYHCQLYHLHILWPMNLVLTETQVTNSTDESIWATQWDWNTAKAKKTQMWFKYGCNIMLFKNTWLCLIPYISECSKTVTGLESREYGHKDPLRWPCSKLYPKKLALTSPTGSGRSVGIVCSWTTGHRVWSKTVMICSGQSQYLKFWMQAKSVCSWKNLTTNMPITVDIFHHLEVPWDMMLKKLDDIQPPSVLEERILRCSVHWKELVLITSSVLLPYI